MSEALVRGKAATIRVSFRGREWYALPGLYRKAWKGATEGNYAAVVPFLARVVESWEFEGDPADEAAYEALDVLGELVPLAEQALLAVAEAAFPPPNPGE